jgi:hypothetical protein
MLGRSQEAPPLPGTEELCSPLHFRKWTAPVCVSIKRTGAVDLQVDLQVVLCLEE